MIWHKGKPTLYPGSHIFFNAVGGLIRVENGSREEKVRLYIPLISCHIPDPSASLEIVVRGQSWALCSFHPRQSAAIVVMSGAVFKYLRSAHKGNRNCSIVDQRRRGRRESSG